MAKRLAPKAKKSATGERDAAGKLEKLDMKSLYEQSKREMRRSKGQIEAGESFASGRRRGPEASPSANRNRWYG